MLWPKGYGEGREPGVGRRRKAITEAVCPKNVGYKHQAESAVGTFGREKRCEQFCADFVGYAGAVIGYGQRQRVRPKGDFNSAVGASRDTFDSVLDNIDNYTLHQHGIETGSSVGQSTVECKSDICRCHGRQSRTQPRQPPVHIDSLAIGRRQLDKLA